MTNYTNFIAPNAAHPAVGPFPPAFTVTAPSVRECSDTPITLSDVADTVGMGGIDAERELHIADCGRHMLAAYARYEASGCLGDRGEADRWRLMQAEAIKARGADVVAQLEAARGLS